MTIRRLGRDDVAELADFLGRQPQSYRAHFHPFQDESKEGLASVIHDGSRDIFWGVFGEDTKRDWLACFMLRGWEEGYERPSFGVIVDHEHQGLGLGRLCLTTATTYCRWKRIPACMLKVSSKNPGAARLYEEAGFRFERVCPSTGHQILAIEFSPK